VGCGRTNPWLRVGDTPQQVTSSSSGVLPARMTHHARPTPTAELYGVVGMACLQRAPPGEAHCVYWWANVRGGAFQRAPNFASLRCDDDRQQHGFLRNPVLKINNSQNQLLNPSAYLFGCQLDAKFRGTLDKERFLLYICRRKFINLKTKEHEPEQR
jgi:hypothetical protein